MTFLLKNSISVLKADSHLGTLEMASRASLGVIGRSPDYILKAMNKATGEKRKIGAGWKNTDGSITVALDSFTVLQSSPDLVLHLFLNDKEANVV